jgi:glycosyltransferase involved in cell wall biosynthesis
MRRHLGIHKDQILVLTIGRITREKGIFDLLSSISVAVTAAPNVRFVILGANKNFDESEAVEFRIRNDPRLKRAIKLLPACNPDEVWEYLCAADIFAFTSRQEGMPNSLLEAMAMGVPAVAFAIPPVLEIEAGKGALVHVPPFDSLLFAQALLHLAEAPAERARIGKLGKSEVMGRFMVQKNMAEALARLSSLRQKRNSAWTSKATDRTSGQTLTPGDSDISDCNAETR